MAQRKFFFTSVLLWLCLSGYELKAQLHRKVLFLGNSYTGVNNLPQLVHDVALSAGDTVAFDSNTPGGYQLIDHSGDATSQAKISAGVWDYVVIQGQSQEPITHNNQFINGGLALAGLVKQDNPCATVMTYMTWGRKNGDAANCPSFPVMCTYEGMDTTLRNEYMDLTSMIYGEASPVSVVWNDLRQHHPNIELYQADESHPSLAGSYAAACSFYAMLFRKDPTLITYSSGLDSTTVSIIKNTAKMLVYDNIQHWDFKRLPVSAFHYEIGQGFNEALLYAHSQGIPLNFLWNFGDGDTSSLQSPVHSYAANGTYTITLTTSNCDIDGLHTSSSDTVITFCSHTPSVTTHQPWLCNYDTLWTQPADAYQWFMNQVPLPETNQYLANYGRYGISGFTVATTVNGCAELSAPFTDSPEWSGYYFDAMGDPCAGDTVHFAVLHIDGFLSGFENILWYKNDTLLSSMTNEDTLLITSPGTYACKVVNSNSNCPLDTTFYMIEYNCAPNAVFELIQNPAWSIFPNPASTAITIKVSKPFTGETLEIYNVMGDLLISESVTETSTRIDIATLPEGLYVVRLPHQQGAIKFMKI